MDHEDILIESYVCESVRVAHFFTHSREAPSLVDRLQYTDLAPGCRQVVRKIWDVINNSFTGHGGKEGEWTSVDHTLLNAT